MRENIVHIFSVVLYLSTNDTAQYPDCYVNTYQYGFTVTPASEISELSGVTLVPYRVPEWDNFWIYRI